MKNKRTKLTAILLSALMAVSTISSVTWAADLFSDGEDITTGTPGVVISDTESDVTISGEAVLTAASSSDFDVVITENGVQWKAYGVDKQGGSYSIKVRYNPDPTATDSSNGWSDWEPTSIKSVVPEPATCEHPKRDRCSFEANDGKIHFAYYINQSDADVQKWIANPEKFHNDEPITVEGFDNDATCEKDGYRIVYRVCSYCGKVAYKDGTRGKDFSNVENDLKLALGGVTLQNGYALNSTYRTFKENLKEKLKENNGPEDVRKALEDYNNLDIPASYPHVNHIKSFELIDNPALGHRYGDGYITVIPPEDHEDYDSAYNPYEDGISSAQKSERIKHWQSEANCVVDETTHQLTGGALDPNKDAFYYNVAKCSICGKIVGDKRNVNGVKYVFWHGNMTEAGKVYKAGKGIKGFIDKDGKARYVETIPEADFKDVILEDCSKEGYYYLCTIDKDGSVVTEKEFIQPAGHHYSYFVASAVSPNVTEDFVLNKDGSIAVTKDEKGNYIAYGINCNKEPYFTVIEKCYNCSLNIASGKLKALPGKHVWRDDNRSIDPTKTVYTFVDEKHHLEQYTDKVQCMYCGTWSFEDSKTPDALVSHKLTSQEVEGTRKEPTCGVDGSVDRADTCICKYVDTSTTTTVKIPATDKHDFGDNKAYLKWSGDVYIKEYGDSASHNIKVYVGRECNVCGLFDGNGINQQGIDHVVNDKGLLITMPGIITVTKTRDAKIDPATGIAYRCSTALATVEVNWVGTVDGEIVKLNKDNTADAVRENVPYYSDLAEYQARTSHTPGKPQKEGDQIVTRCTVCGDIVAQEDDNTPSVGVPTVTATSIDFDTVNVNWTKVDGATAYRLYYRSSDEGISKWAKIRTFTGDTTSFAVNGLTTGSKYRFTVRAEVTQDGKTNLGDYNRKGAVAVPKLTAPEIKSVTASGKTTKVTWSRVDGASGYIVFRNSQRVGTVTKGSKVSWTDKKPVSGAKYQVRAYRTEDKKNYKSDLSEPK